MDRRWSQNKVLLDPLGIPDRLALLSKIIKWVAETDGNVLERLQLLEHFERIFSAGWEEFLTISLYEYRSLLWRFEVWLRIICNQILTLLRHSQVTEQEGLELLNRLTVLMENFNKIQVPRRKEEAFLSLSLSEAELKHIQLLLQQQQGGQSFSSSFLSWKMKDLDRAEILFKNLEKVVKAGRPREEVGAWVRGISSLFRESRRSGGNLTDIGFVGVVKGAVENVLGMLYAPVNLYKALLWTIVECVPEFKDERKVAQVVPLLYSLLQQLRECNATLYIDAEEFQSWKVHLQTYLTREEFSELEPLFPNGENMWSKSGLAQFYPFPDDDLDESFRAIDFSATSADKNTMKVEDCIVSGRLGLGTNGQGRDAMFASTSSINTVSCDAECTERRKLSTSMNTIDGVVCESVPVSVEDGTDFVDTRNVYRDKIKVQRDSLLVCVNERGSTTAQGKYIREIWRIFKESVDDCPMHGDVWIISNAVVFGIAKLARQAPDSACVAAFRRALIWTMLGLYPMLKTRDAHTIDFFSNTFLNLVASLAHYINSKEASSEEQEQYSAWLKSSKPFLSANQRRLFYQVLPVQPFSACKKTTFNEFYPQSLPTLKIGLQSDLFPPLQKEVNSTASSKETLREFENNEAVTREDKDCTSTVGAPARTIASCSSLSVSPPKYPKKVPSYSAIAAVAPKPTPPPTCLPRPRIDRSLIGSKPSPLFPKEEVYRELILAERKELLQSIVQQKSRTVQGGHIKSILKLFRESAATPDHNDLGLVQTAVVHKAVQASQSVGEAKAYAFKKAIVWTLVGLFPLVKFDTSISRLCNIMLGVQNGVFRMDPSQNEVEEYFAWLGAVKPFVSKECCAKLSAPLKKYETGNSFLKKNLTFTDFYPEYTEPKKFHYSSDAFPSLSGAGDVAAVVAVADPEPPPSPPLSAKPSVARSDSPWSRPRSNTVCSNSSSSASAIIPLMSITTELSPSPVLEADPWFTISKPEPSLTPPCEAGGDGVKNISPNLDINQNEKLPKVEQPDQGFLCSQQQDFNPMGYSFFSVRQAPPVPPAPVSCWPPTGTDVLCPTYPTYSDMWSSGTYSTSFPSYGDSKPAMSCLGQDPRWASDAELFK